METAHTLIGEKYIAEFYMDEIEVPDSDYSHYVGTGVIKQVENPQEKITIFRISTYSELQYRIFSEDLGDGTVEAIFDSFIGQLDRLRITSEDEKRIKSFSNKKFIDLILENMLKEAKSSDPKRMIPLIDLKQIRLTDLLKA